MMDEWETRPYMQEGHKRYQEWDIDLSRVQNAVGIKAPALDLYPHG
jgi:hypothetical protein